MPTTAQVEIAALHLAYCQGTGMALPLDAAREMQWYEVWRRGIRAQDVRELIRLMKWKKRNDQPVRSLTFRNFVGNADYLEEDIAEMRARQRSAPREQTEKSDRAAVLKASGRASAPEPPQGRPVGAVLDEALSADFDALKRAIQEGTL